MCRVSLKRCVCVVTTETNMNQNPAKIVQGTFDTNHTTIQLRSTLFFVHKRTNSPELVVRATLLVNTNK